MNLFAVGREGLQHLDHAAIRQQAGQQNGWALGVGHQACAGQGTKSQQVFAISAKGRHSRPRSGRGQAAGGNPGLPGSPITSGVTRGWSVTDGGAGMMALRLLAGSGSMDYTFFMKFEWDEAKSDACFR